MYACSKYPRAQLALLSAKVPWRLFAHSMPLLLKMSVPIVANLCVLGMLKDHRKKLCCM